MYVIPAALQNGTAAALQNGTAALQNGTAAALQNGTAAPDPTVDAIDFLSFLLSL